MSQEGEPKDEHQSIDHGGNGVDHRSREPDSDEGGESGNDVD